MRTRALQLKRLENPMTFWFLVFCLTLFVSLYVYLVNQTVWNVVSRQKAEATVGSLSSKTAELESTYISMKNNINLNLAQAIGFSSTKDTKYIPRTTLGQISSNAVE